MHYICAILTVFDACPAHNLSDSTQSLSCVSPSSHAAIIPLTCRSPVVTHLAPVTCDRTGNEDGEPVIEERQIRIGDTMSPLRSAAAAEEGDAAGSSMLEREEFDASALAAMAGDHDQVGYGF